MSDSEHRLNTCLLRASLAFERHHYVAAARSYREALAALETLYSQLPDVKRVVQRAYYRVFRAELMSSVSLTYWKMFTGDGETLLHSDVGHTELGGHRLVPSGTASATVSATASANLAKSVQALDTAIRLCPDPLYYERSAIFNLEQGKVTDAFEDLGKVVLPPFISRTAVLPALGRAYLVSPSVVLALRAILAAHKADVREAMSLVSQAFTLLGRGLDAIECNSRGAILMRQPPDAHFGTGEGRLTVETTSDARICLLALCEISRLIADRVVKLPVRLDSNLEGRLRELFQREPAGVSVNALLDPQALAQFSFSVYADLGGDQSLPGRGLDQLPTIAALFRSVFRDCLSDSVLVGRFAGYTSPSIVSPEVRASLCRVSVAYSRIVNDSSNLKVLLDQDVRAWFQRTYGVLVSNVFSQPREGVTHRPHALQANAPRVSASRVSAPQASGLAVSRDREETTSRCSSSSTLPSALTLEDLNCNEAMATLLRSLGKPEQGVSSNRKQEEPKGLDAQQGPGTSRVAESRVTATTRPVSSGNPKPLLISRSQTPERRSLPIAETRSVEPGKKYVPVLSPSDIRELRTRSELLESLGGSFTSGAREATRMAATASIGELLDSLPLEYYSPRRTTCEVCPGAKPAYAARRITDSEEITAIQRAAGGAATPIDLGSGAETPTPRLSLSALVQAKMERIMASSSRARQILTETVSKARSGAQDLGLSSKVLGGAGDQELTVSDANFDLSTTEIARLRRESPSLRSYSREREATPREPGGLGDSLSAHTQEVPVHHGFLPVGRFSSRQPVAGTASGIGEMCEDDLLTVVEGSLVSLSARDHKEHSFQLPESLSDAGDPETPIHPESGRSAHSGSGQYRQRDLDTIRLSRTSRHFDTLSNSIATKLTVAALSHPGSRASDFASINNLQIKMDAVPPAPQTGSLPSTLLGWRGAIPPQGQGQKAAIGGSARSGIEFPDRGSQTHVSRVRDRSAHHRNESGSTVSLSGDSREFLSSAPSASSKPNYGDTIKRSQKELTLEEFDDRSIPFSGEVTQTRHHPPLGASGHEESREIDAPAGETAIPGDSTEEQSTHNSVHTQRMSQPRDPRPLDRAFVVPTSASPRMLKTTVSTHLFVVG